MTAHVTFAVIGALVGATLGSFAGVVRSRGWRAALRGRSRCDGCRRELHWFELVPLVSYPLQRGRCRSCGAQIDRTTLLVEVAGAAFGAGLALAIATAVSP